MTTRSPVEASLPSPLLEVVRPSGPPPDHPPTIVQLARARAGLEAPRETAWVDPHRPSVTPAGSEPCLTYRQWYETIAELAACLVQQGLRTGERVLLVSETRMEWFQADLAIVSAGGVTVPVYPTLPASQMEEILTDSEAGMAVVSRPGLLEELMRAPSSARRIRGVVLIDAPAEPSACGTRVLSWAAALELGRRGTAEVFSQLAVIASRLLPQDPATLIYTSGTSGRMKGVVLTHENLLASAVSSARRIGVVPEDVYLSFLPMSHVLERVVHLSMLWAGARIAYGEGLDRLEQDLARARPTIIVGVPRLYEKVLRAAEKKAEALGRVGTLIFRLAVRSACLAGRRGPFSSPRGPLTPLWDLLVYRRVRKALGGRARILISGGSPLGRREALFFNGAGLALVEGYGLTETASVVAVATPEAWRLGSVGLPLPGIEVRIAANGEICLKGASVMAGYHRDEEATRLALSDGWLHTGDVGSMNAQGFLFVTDRLKDLIATAQGKKVAPQLIEGLLRRSPLISTVVVLGDRRPFLVALVFPDLEHLRAKLGLRLPDGPELGAALMAPGVRALYRTEIDRQSMELAPHEIVREFLLLPHPPSLNLGELTPTGKVKRQRIEERYAKVIDALFVVPRR